MYTRSLYGFHRRNSNTNIIIKMTNKLLTILVIIFFAGFKEIVSLDSCPVVNTNDDYAKTPYCDELNANIAVYEDTPTNLIIFEVDDGWQINEDCQYTFTQDQTFGFVKVINAEEPPREYICVDFLKGPDDKTYFGIFDFLNVNEFYPEPVSIDDIETVDIDEGTTGIVLQFGYMDEDTGETESLTFQKNFDTESDEYFDLIEDIDASDDSQKIYKLITKSELDYETNNFFSMQAVFISVDERGKELSTTQYFYVRLIDIDDNPPFFTKVVPSVQFEEEQPEGIEVFSVDARDGDLSLDNTIEYSIIDGNEDEYFTIDESAGTVSSNKIIDREKISSTLFSLVILALEAPGEAPTGANSISQGDSGTYDIASDNPNVIIAPQTGSANTTLTFTLLPSDDFDYELNQDVPVTITVTATEKSNADNKDTFQLEVTLLDINDNAPEFQSLPYDVVLNETVPSESDVITVIALDNDVSLEFNEESIVYSLSGCNEFAINEETGRVTTTQVLDYESEKEITCTITASDMLGETTDSLDSKTTLRVSVLDINDETPNFVDFIQDPVNLSEDSALNTLVAPLCITDEDTTANLSVSLEFPNSSPEVQSWLNFIEVDDPNCDKLSTKSISGEIRVADVLDREIQQDISIDVVAVDGNTAINSAERRSTLIVNLEDVNDEYPYFLNDYSQQTLQEEKELGYNVLQIEANDDDMNEALIYAVSDNTYLDINATGILFVTSRIDREAIDRFSLDIIVTDKVNHETSVQMTVIVEDLNDNPPILEEDICNDFYDILENAANGTAITTISATDDDQGVHKTIVYQLSNNEFSNAPFNIDANSGSLTVQYDKGEVLDRELENEWTLLIEAYDTCAESEVNCQNNKDTCQIKISVLDENDNPPGQIEQETILTGESITEGGRVSDDALIAVDPDEGDAAAISFKVLTMTEEDSGNEIDPLVETRDENEDVGGVTQYFCRLFALKDFTHLRGRYVMEIETSDRGEPVQRSTSFVTLVIQDSNDENPYFKFSSCEDPQTIVLQESTPEMVDVALTCPFGGTANEFQVYLLDDDLPGSSNADVDLVIDYDNSFSNGGDNNQISLFEVQKKSANIYNIIASDILNREYGNEYNLSLIASDNGEPSLISESYVIVIITDVDEYPPGYCNLADAPCSQTIQIYENDGSTFQFQKAIDPDNSRVNESDVGFQKIGYRITSGNADFEIPDSTVNAMRTSDAEGLDRETQALYDVQIEAYSYIGSTITPDDTSVLYVRIVLLDVNDNAPYYPQEVLYGDYLESGNEGDQVAIVEFSDADSDESITYSLLDDFDWSETPSDVYNEPFAIKQEAGSNIAEIYLNMDPDGTTGYCTFTVVATDKEGIHNGSTTAVVFVITDEYVVEFIFENSIAEVQTLQNEIEVIFSVAFNSTCIIDSISPDTDDSNNEIPGQTEVSAHFIEEEDDGEYDLVTKAEIENMASDGEVANMLINSLELMGLSLLNIGDTDAIFINEDDEQIRNLKIALGTVTLVLGLLLLALIIVYFDKTSNLKRQVRALSDNIYTSKSSGIDKGGLETKQMPGTNMFTSTGTNPIFNVMDEPVIDLGHDNRSMSDTESIIGIEDHPDFNTNSQRNYNSGPPVGPTSPPFDTNHIYDSPSTNYGVDSNAIPTHSGNENTHIFQHDSSLW